jgi:hypothetical protein
MDLLQDAGLLDQLPENPEDNTDFDVGNDTYMIEACTCGSSTCLEWNALSMENAIDDQDSDPDLVITLAVRAKALGYRRLSDYLKEMQKLSHSLALHLSRLPMDQWVDTCKAYDPLAVGLAMSIVSDMNIAGQGGQPDDDIAWNRLYPQHQQIH